MTAPTLIGLIGKKRAGKDSFAQALVEGHGFARVAFADPLKATMLDLDPWVRIEEDEVGPLKVAGFPVGASRLAGEGVPWRLSFLVSAVGWEAAKGVREVRRLLQAHGVAIRTHVDPEVWVQAAMRTVRDLREGVGDYLGTATSPAPCPVVVTDVRFPNEADAIKAAGGKLVRITRPGLTSTDEHVSEIALDDYPADAHVVNAGTLEDLRGQARVIVLLNR